MEEKIQNLVALQRVEWRLKELEKFLQQVPGEKETLAAEERQAAAEMAAEREKLEAVRKKLRRKEAELVDGEERLKQIQLKLNQVKTNKEYEAALKELDERRAANSALETEILALYDEVEVAEKKSAQLEAGWKERQAEFDRRRQQLEDKAAAAAEESESRQREREKILARIDPQILARYRLVCERYFPAVVHAEKEICRGCNTIIPPQVYNDVLKGDQLISCPGCQRLLVSSASCLGESIGEAAE